MTDSEVIHHRISRETFPGSGVDIRGRRLIPAILLPKGHSASKLRVSGSKNGVGIRGPVHREIDQEDVMVVAEPLKKKKIGKRR